MRPLCFFLLLVGVWASTNVNPGFAQHFRRGFDPSHTLRDLKIDIWNSRRGMVSNNVTSVFQSKDDYLWITSYNGLQRFDGINFQSFDQSQIPFLRAGTFNEITQDNQGILWFATGASGLIGYDGTTFLEHPLKDSIPISIISILSDSKNNLWIGTSSRGLFKITGDGSFTHIANTPKTTVYNIFEDSQGTIWGAFDGGGIFSISDTEVVSYERHDGLNWDLINATIAEYNGVIYIGSGGGINTISGDKVDHIPTFEGAKVGDITIDDYGFLWASTNNGLARYHIENQSYEILTVDEGLPSDRIVDLFFDNEGSLWISSYEAGLIRLKTSRITNMTVRHGLSSNKVSIIGIDNGKYFIGGQNGVVNIYDGNKVTQLDMNPAFGTDVIRDFLFEEDAMWVASYDGLLKINKTGRQTFYNEASGLPNIGFRRIFKDSKGTIWLGSRNGGLTKFDRTGNNHETFDVTDGEGPNYVLDIAEDSHGNLIIGTNAAGLLIKTDKTFERYHVMEDDAATLIFGVAVREDDIIWLCTNFGLFYLKDEQIHKITLYPKINIEKFFDIVFDNQGGAWLTSEKGVYNIKIDDLMDFVEGKLSQVPYDRFGVGDGMESDECTGATRSTVSNETQKIWIPTFEGVSIISPTELPKNQRKPRVLITGMHIDQHLLIPSDEQIEVSPGAFRYVFDATALSYLGPTSVQFRYKLEGIDGDWSEPTSRRSVEYTNLPHGDYRLKVMASNNDGIWNTEGETLEFSILPFFYETWYFKLAVIVILLGMGRLAYVWRTQNIKATNKALSKMNSELDRFVYSASHDLRGPLSSIMGLVDLGLTDDSAKEKDKYFTLIKECNTKMDDFIRDLINYSKNKNDKIIKEDFSLSDSIQKVLDGLRRREPYHNVDFNVKIECADICRGDQTRLKVILRNILHNSIVFSDTGKTKSEVHIKVDRVDHKIKISIQDNGIGIARKNQHKVFDMFYRSSALSKGAGLGLYVAAQTCQKLRGEIAVISEEGVGSEFLITIPVR